MKIYAICYHFVKLFKLIRAFIVPLNMFFLICWCACTNIWKDNHFAHSLDRLNRKKKGKKKRSNQSYQNKQLDHVGIEFLQSWDTSHALSPWLTTKNSEDKELVNWNKTVESYRFPFIRSEAKLTTAHI